MNELGRGSLGDASYILNIKALGLVVLDKNFFSCFAYISLCVKHVTPGHCHFWPQGHNLNKLGRGLQGGATY